MRLDRPDVNALGSEFVGTGCLRSVGKGVIAVNTEANLIETGIADQGGKRCLRQRAGNSAGPEIDIVSC